MSRSYFDHNAGGTGAKPAAEVLKRTDVVEFTPSDVAPAQPGETVTLEGSTAVDEMTGEHERAAFLAEFNARLNK